MKLIIDIPEQLYKDAVELDYMSPRCFNELKDAVKNGSKVVTVLEDILSEMDKHNLNDYRVWDDWDDGYYNGWNLANDSAKGYIQDKIEELKGE